MRLIVRYELALRDIIELPEKIHPMRAGYADALEIARKALAMNSQDRTA